MMKKYNGYVYVFAILWFVATAYFSVGYYHPDEHYQIIEFARLKQGLNVPSDLAWEYEAQIRSTVQPLLAYLVFSVLHLFSVTDPYLLALVLRVLSAAFLLLGITLWVKQQQEKFSPTTQLLFVFLSYGFFLIPMVSVRFSSETWSAGCILMALTALSPRKIDLKASQLSMGMWLGLAFLFRFQTISLAFGLLLWLWWNNRRSLLVPLGMLLVFLSGLLMDRWFYGEWVFTFWNYLDYNLVRGVAASFGVAPWYEYFLYVYRSFTPFMGLMVLFALAYFMLRHRQHVFTWMLIPFLLVHMLIAHKEDRFLFPILYFLPLILCVSIDDVKNGLAASPMKWPRPVFTVVLALCLGVNLLGLVFTSFSPLRSTLVLTEYIEDNFDQQSVVLLNARHGSPYYIGDHLYARHYVQSFVKEVAIDSTCALSRFPYPDSVKVLLMVDEVALKEGRCKSEWLQQSSEWRLLVQSTPPWLYWLQQHVRFVKGKRNVLLYERIRK